MELRNLLIDWLEAELLGARSEARASERGTKPTKGRRSWKGKKTHRWTFLKTAKNAKKREGISWWIDEKLSFQECVPKGTTTLKLRSSWTFGTSKTEGFLVPKLCFGTGSLQLCCISSWFAIRTGSSYKWIVKRSGASERAFRRELLRENFEVHGASERV